MTPLGPSMKVGISISCQRLRPIHFAYLLFTVLLFNACNEEEPDLLDQSQINIWKYFRQSNGLASNSINTIYEDSKGNFWVGTDKGLSVYDGKNFTTYTTADGLLNNNIFAINEDRDGDMWAGSPSGLNILRNGEWFYFTFFYGAGIYSLLELENEAGILIGTGGYGIYRYDYTAVNFSPFHYIENCAGCNSINSLLQASDESVWVASFQGAQRLKGSTVTRYEKKDGLSGDIATTIAEDSWGNIWIGTVEGSTISKISDKTISKVTFNNGASQNFIFGIQEDNTGNLWVGTVANGLFQYDGAIMRQIHELPPGNTITALLKDSRGNLWVGTSGEGLAHYITNPLP